MARIKGLLFVVTLIFTLQRFSQPIFAASDGTTTWQHINNIPDPGSGTQQTATLILDIDKDGLNDFVVAERTGTPSVVWYKKTGANWTKNIIHQSQLRIEAGGAFFDIDNDNDLDVIFGNDGQGNQIWWWENPYPNFGSPWTRYTIKNTGGNKHHDMGFADVDGDGRTEFITWNQRDTRLLLAEIPTNPRTLWNFTPIYTWSAGNEREGLGFIDIDGDNKIDIVGGGYWFKHQTGTTFQRNVIDETMNFSRTAVGQLVPGGRPEVVFGCGDCDGPLKWYQWTNNAWQASTLLATIKNGHSLQISDINRDGHLDIFAGEMELTTLNPRSLFYYGNGQGNFTQRVLDQVQAHHESKLGDLDGDGDVDLLAKPYGWQTPRVDVFLNQGSGGQNPTPTPTTGGGGSLDNWQTHIIGTRSHAWRTLLVGATDLTGDGKKDIIAGGNWYRNPGTIGGTWTRSLIGAGASNFAAYIDFDNDGDQDILATNGEHVGSGFVWAQNNGTGTFTMRTNVPAGTGDFLQGVAPAKFTTGGPTQIALSWHRNGPVQMLTVPATATNPWTIATVTTNSLLEDLTSGDIDRDGDQDILQGNMWLRNNGTSWSQHTLFTTTDHADRNNLADINRDGRLDAIIGYEAINVAGKIAWYEQNPTATAAWTEHIIATNVIGPMSLDTGDIDRDGDIDVVVGEHNLNAPATAKAFVFENRNNGAQWIRHQIGIGHEHHDGMQLADFDNDNDLDIVSIGWGHGNVIVYENKNSGGTNPTPTPTPTTPNNPTATPTSPPDSTLRQKLANWFTSNHDTNLDNLFNIVDWLNPFRTIIPTPTTVGPTATNTPPANPTNTPTPGPTGPPGQGERLLFNTGILQFTTANNGFLPIKEAGTNIPGIPINWLTPQNYYNGTWHFRYQVTQQPGNIPGALQLCIWNMPGFKPESCSPNIAHTGVGTYTASSVPAAWWKLNGVPLNFANSTSFLIRMVLRGPGNCNVTRHDVAKDCWDQWPNYENLKFKVTVVIVPQGQTFSGWQNYPL